MHRLALFLICLLALGIRLYDLTDPPFDFHPTRQFRSVIMARGMYYENRTDISEAQRASFVRLWKKEAIIEPPVLERLVAWTYSWAGGEHIWVARVYSSLFWVSAGLAVFLIGQEMGLMGGGLLAALYFLFVPYGIIASRTFQPDPLMVTLMAWGLWALVRWYRAARPLDDRFPVEQERRTLGLAVLAGLLIGLAIYIKTVAGILLAGALMGVAVSAVQLQQGKWGFRPWMLAIRNPRVWVFIVLIVLPTALYYLYGFYIQGFLRQQLNFRFFPDMWTNPAFYVQWTNMATGIAGFTLLTAGVVGAFLWREALRGMSIGLWVGYALYSLTFPYHTTTHDYYQLPLILVVAVGLIPLANLLLEQLAQQDHRRLIQGVLAGAVVYMVLFRVWEVRMILARQDDRDAPTRFGRFAEIIPPNQRLLAMTQAYGYPLAYYASVNVELWPSTSDAALRELAGITGEELERRRASKLKGRDLFLVTDFVEFDRQADWQAYLFSHFAILDEGDGYILFDLNAPLENQP